MLYLCTRKESYICKTKRNVESWWQEHRDIIKISESLVHLKRNPTQVFKWNVLMNDPSNDRVWKNLDASFTGLSRPSLNEQIYSKKLLLFWSRVTWQNILLICNYLQLLNKSVFCFWYVWYSFLWIYLLVVNIAWPKTFYFWKLNTVRFVFF